MLDDAVAAIADLVPQRQTPRGLQAIVHAAVDKMKDDKWLYEEKITTGRFRQGHALRVDWTKSPWSNPDSPDGAPAIFTERPARDDEMARC